MKPGSLVKFQFLLLLGVFVACVLGWMLSSNDITASMLLGKITPDSSMWMAQRPHRNDLYRNVLQNQTDGPSSIERRPSMRPPLRPEETDAVSEEKRYTQNSSHTPCIPWQNIVYIKTHKTASSTLQNILYRFGDERDLTFALPVRDVYIGSISKVPPSSVLPAPPGVAYNILANHARFLYDDIKKLMPTNSKFVTIIRKSPTQFRSMYNYFVMQSIYKVSLEEFSRNPKFFYERHRRKSRHNGRDPMLFDLGMDQSSIGDLHKTEQYIKFLDSKLSLVLIREYFFESLILLKEELCWDLRSLVHLSNKIRISIDPTDSLQPMVDSEMSAGLEKRLTEWNAGDVMLYNYFNATLWRKIEAYGRRKMDQEVAELKDLCEQFEKECMKGTKPRNISRGSMKHTGLAEYVVKADKRTNKTCQRLGPNSREYLANLRQKHTAMYHRKS
ncbi:galactosylceramide sulfotransferase-like [Diadema antillarum]|uniref:galactosylceramide sulfotransferase-like n=1 Tax=Diadema antillarum TaxID=105358 RepID=UPI003A87C60F